ncbi:MAG: hypothetical protein ACRYF4_13140 [Janthinobacterium lividum]
MKPSDPRITVTSAEVLARKHLVQTYADLPVVQHQPGVVTCTHCSNPGLRRSRLRRADMARLLVACYPFRCSRCGRRQHLFLLTAIRSLLARTG